MDTFNVIAGIVTIFSLILTVYMYLSSKRKESVERERFNSQSAFLTNIYNSTNAIVDQTNLIGVLSDREETSKKEIKHLAVSSLATIRTIQLNLESAINSRRRWRFGIPSAYFRLESSHSQIAKEEAERQKDE